MATPSQTRGFFTFSKIIFFLGLAVMVGIIVYRQTYTPPAPPSLPMPVRATTATIVEINRYFTGLGTVVPLHTTVIQSRVDGHLVAVHFREGQEVQKGDLLAEIDPRPFLVRLEQAKGALVRNEALLNNARLELERYSRLFRQEAVPAQQLQAQEAAVGQYEGAVIQDKAAIAEAELQLAYSRVTAPFTGKAGLRQVDVGATIRSSDPAGIVRLTRTRPTYVVFSLVENSIPEVRRAMREVMPQTEAVLQKPAATATEAPATAPDQIEAEGREAAEGQADVNALMEAAAMPEITEDGPDQTVPKEGLVAEIWSQDNKYLLDSGILLSLDNQIDPATGTVKAKAIVANEEDFLFPNQFVNVRLLVDIIKDVPSIPTAAVQRSSTGFFVYVIRDGKANLVPITPGYSNGPLTVIEEGIAQGDVVVTDGLDKLRDGIPVRYTMQD